jgi:hypothetical protein
VTTKSMNGTAHDRRAESPVSDLDLMLYLDGELSDDRHEEVRRTITRDKVLRGKLDALELSSTILRERVSDAAINIDLTDAVMAQIASHKSDVSLDERDNAPVAREVQAIVAPIAPTVSLDKLGSRTKPSNDNARGIFALAAFAVAAAAGLMIWGRMAPAPSTEPTPHVAVVATPEVPNGAAPTEEIEPAKGADAVADSTQDEEVGVEVAAVDFGSRVGTIFYVPTEAATSKHTTTVVWLTDPDGDGE